MGQLLGQLLQPHVTARGWWGPGTSEESPSQPETFSDARLCRKCQNQLWKPGCVGICFVFNCGKKINKKCNIKLTILTFLGAQFSGITSIHGFFFWFNSHHHQSPELIHLVKLIPCTLKWEPPIPCFPSPSQPPYCFLSL